MVLENVTSVSMKVLEFYYQNIVGTLHSYCCAREVVLLLSDTLNVLVIYLK